MSKRKIIRVGDTVEIVIPNVFIRCGYPIDISELAETLLKKHQDKFREFTYVNYPEIPRATVDEIRDVAFAYAKVIARGKRFGGSKRRIYTIHIPSLKGRTCQVLAKKVVYTGERVPAYHGHEGDVEPPFLADAKAHVILELNGYYTLKTEETTVEGFSIIDDYSNVIRIESCNVQKLESPI